jgi:hypothetical protein
VAAFFFRSTLYGHFCNVASPTTPQSRNLYIALVNMLTKRNLTPCVIFTFRCLPQQYRTRLKRVIVLFSYRSLSKCMTTYYCFEITNMRTMKRIDP